jgi:hypothetical protein
MSGVYDAEGLDPQRCEPLFPALLLLLLLYDALKFPPHGFGARAAGADLLVDGLRVLEVVSGLLRVAELKVDYAQVTQLPGFAQAVADLGMNVEGLLVVLLRLLPLSRTGFTLRAFRRLR